MQSQYYTPEQIEQERRLEEAATGITKARVEEAVKRTGLAETTGGKMLVKRALDDVASTIERWLEEQAKPHGRTSPAFKFLNLLTPDQLAFITIRSLLNTLRGIQRYDGVIDTIAEHGVIPAARAALFEKQDSAEFARLTKKLNWQPRTFVRERIAHEEFSYAGIELDITPAESAAVGAVLLELTIETTGLFEVVHIGQAGGRTDKRLNPTEKGQKWLEEALAFTEMAEPFNLPMVIEPYPWTNLRDGGYLLQDLHPAEFVRLPHGERSRPLLEEADLSAAMEAVNHIQNTPWRINKRVCDVWQKLIGTGMAGCSTDERVEVPAPVEPEDPTFDMVKARRRNAFERIRENNATLCSEAQKKRMLQHLKDAEQFYYPHNLDFRGRVYPLAGVGAINPQGDDSGKALIEFAKGQPLGEDGLQWLYIHAQNCWGNDKVSLQDRIDATESQKARIWQYGHNPLGHTGWMEADKPFGFLACCFELYEIWLMEAYGGNPANYESHIPIALDGSCSGLQHFAGIMLDKPLASAVNVIQSGDQPADIYTQVAEKVSQLVTEDDTPEAEYWRGKVSRDLVKQPVMTLSYGVTSSGMRQQVQDKCKKLVYKKGKEEYALGATGGNPAYMASVIQTAISDVSRAAFDVMHWLSRAAETMADAFPDSLDGALSWTSPIGLPVLQEYYEYDMHRVNVFVDGRRIRFSRKLGAAVVKKSKQRQAAAPNFVHSMDAAHLMMTVNEAAFYEIDSFAMIHDSFATHAADTGVLFEVLRDRFAAMYQRDVLMEMYEGLPPEVREKLDPPPTRGDLQLDEVQESEFFFA